MLSVFAYGIVGEVAKLETDYFLFYYSKKGLTLKIKKGSHYSYTICKCSCFLHYYT